MLVESARVQEFLHASAQLYDEGQDTYSTQ